MQAWQFCSRSGVSLWIDNVLSCSQPKICNFPNCSQPSQNFETGQCGISFSLWSSSSRSSAFSIFNENLFQYSRISSDWYSEAEDESLMQFSGFGSDAQYIRTEGAVGKDLKEIRKCVCNLFSTLAHIANMLSLHMCFFIAFSCIWKRKSEQKLPIETNG